MTDAAVDRILSELAAVRRLLERLAPPPLTPQQRELFDALVLVIGSAPFTAAEALELARVPLGDRPRLAAALAAVGAKDAHKMGMALSALAQRTATLDVRLVRAGSEGGSALWKVEGAPGA